MELSAELVTLVGVVVAVVEIVKRTVPQLPKRFIPLASVVLGLVLGIFSGFSWFEGLVLGLAASGVYDTGKLSVLNR